MGEIKNPFLCAHIFFMCQGGYTWDKDGDEDLIGMVDCSFVKRNLILVFELSSFFEIKGDVFREKFGSLRDGFVSRDSIFELG